MATIEGLALWIALAFALWLVMALLFDANSAIGTRIAAALLSWVIARVAMSIVPVLLEWLESRLRT